MLLPSALFSKVEYGVGFTVGVAVGVAVGVDVGVDVIPHMLTASPFSIPIASFQ